MCVCVYLLIDTMRLNCRDNRSTASDAAAECVFGVFIDNLISDLFAKLFNDRWENQRNMGKFAGKTEETKCLKIY